MSSRLNVLFQAGPLQFLENTVLFTDGLNLSGALRNRITSHLDIQPLKDRATVRVLSGIHEYTDAPLTSYFAASGQPALVPKADPPYRFVFFPEFVRCRLLIREEGAEWLRVECEENVGGATPRPEDDPSSPYRDSFGYWDYTTGHLVGAVRATTVLVKEPDKPWQAMMQQIVGAPGFEVVRTVFSRWLFY